MKIFLWAGRAFEPWDWRNPESPGIGGSETAQAEMARRLAARGHDVTSYAPIRDDTIDDGPVKWRHCDTADFNEPGTWFIFRSPEAADRFEPANDRKFIHISQDVSYFEGCGGAYTPERAAKFESIVGLCEVHCDFLRTQYPFMADKVVQSSNGICTDRMPVTGYDYGYSPQLRDTIKKYPCELVIEPRDPHKLVWSSSPDRGLEALLLILQRALEFEPRLKLHVFYGFDNWDKVIESARQSRETKLTDVSLITAAESRRLESCVQESMKKRIMDLAAACGDAVVWGGRIGQSQLWRELLTAGLWVYPSTFEETSCISCMEAQACGAIPVCNPYWACAQNVEHGVFVQGNPLHDPLTRSRYVQWIVRLVRDQELCQQIRGPMMPWAREHFDWERIVDQWESWCVADEPAPLELLEAACC